MSITITIQLIDNNHKIIDKVCNLDNNSEQIKINIYYLIGLWHKEKHILGIRFKFKNHTTNKYIMKILSLKSITKLQQPNFLDRLIKTKLEQL